MYRTFAGFGGFVLLIMGCGVVGSGPMGPGPGPGPGPNCIRECPTPAHDGGVIPPPDMGMGHAPDLFVACAGGCDSPNPCMRGRCDTARNVCVFDPLPDQTTCGGGGGKCWSGQCCTGCWDGHACVGGASVTACGAQGGLCQSCDDGNICTQDMCTASGKCNRPNAPNGTTCSPMPGAPGVCQYGVCKDCGKSSQLCCGGMNCSGDTLVCNGLNTCVDCGQSGEPCCKGSVCGAPDLVCVLFTNQCTECGHQNQPCCTGSTCGLNLACTGGVLPTCQCGQLNQPCCNGTTCSVGFCSSGKCR